jgi:ketosteroid isomerase-like protein
MEQIERPESTATDDRAAAARMYAAWDRALADADVEGLLACYTSDALLESPLVPHLLDDKEDGILHGHAELRRLFETLKRRKPKLRGHYRAGYFTDGKTLMFEYPRAAPDGEQMDFVEVMHLRDGLIAHHKVYWGWRGMKVLNDDAYRS